MKVALDTSVLVAGVVQAHPAHGRCVGWLRRASRGEIELLVATHALAETYAVLTVLPVKPRIAPAAAWRLIQANVLRSAEVMPLGVDDYRAVLEGLARRALAGGVTYDALLARAAEVGEAELLVTLNPEHFRRVWPEGGERVVGA